jgi:cytolethal distending toxin subunit B
MRAITWNMQGGTNSLESKWRFTVSRLIKRFDPDFLCLQEAGALPPSSFEADPPPLRCPPGTVAPATNQDGAPCRFVHWFPGDQEGAIWNFFWMETDLRGRRVNLAVGSKDFPEQLLYVPPTRCANGRGGKRPSIGIGMPNNLQIWTVHANSMGPHDPPINDAVNLLEEISIFAAMTPNISWAALGDYNNSPDSLENGIAAKNPPLNPPLSVSPPDGMTHQSGAELDYLAEPANQPVHADRVGGQVLTQIHASDHFPVFYYLNTP